MSAKRKKKDKRRISSISGGREKQIMTTSNDEVSKQSSSLPDISDIIKQIEDKLKSKVITYYLQEGAQINDDAMVPLYKQLMAIGKQERINLFVHSRGGATETPWKIIEMFRNFCKFFCVMVAYRAHSAATHVALGANEIIMTSFAELGPVDPYRTHPLLPKGADEKPISISVQDLKHCVSFIKREADIPYTPDALAQLFSAMFEKIHPLAAGAIEQSYALSQIISEKALSTHMDPEKDGEKIKKIADTLLNDYKSHKFQIGRLEAKRIGLPVVEADDDLEELLWKLYESYNQLETLVPKAIPQQSGKFQKIIANIDSMVKRFACVAIFEQDKTGAFKSISGSWREIT